MSVTLSMPIEMSPANTANSMAATPRRSARNADQRRQQEAHHHSDIAAPIAMQIAQAPEDSGRGSLDMVHSPMHPSPRLCSHGRL